MDLFYICYIRHLCRANTFLALYSSTDLVLYYAALLSTSIQDVNAMNGAAIMVGVATYRPPQDNATAQQLNDLCTQIQALRTGGDAGSIARSTAFHAACEKNSPKIAQLLLDIEPAVIESKNGLDRTPLMTEQCCRTLQHQWPR